jgi:hypothetical protein
MILLQCCRDRDVSALRRELFLTVPQIIPVFVAPKSPLTATADSNGVHLDRAWVVGVCSGLAPVVPHVSIGIVGYVRRVRTPKEYSERRATTNTDGYS